MTPLHLRMMEDMRTAGLASGTRALYLDAFIWFIYCLIVPNGCPTVSRRRSRTPGRFARRAAIRSNTASFSRRHTVRNVTNLLSRMIVLNRDHLS
jgi:hypothetical protein